jgi:hypothetical protein
MTAWNLLSQPFAQFNAGLWRGSGGAAVDAKVVSHGGDLHQPFASPFIQ